MKIEEFVDKWSEIPPSETLFQRVDDRHILDIFIGRDMDKRRELLIVSEKEPSKVNSCRSLSIQKGVRNDGKWAIRIRLLRSDSDEVFTHLCWDLIEYSRKASTKAEAIEIFVARYLKWQELLEAGSQLLPEETIKGLIGELLYAEKYLHPMMSWDEVFSSWLGPDGSEKDFIFADTWSEVKTVAHSKLTVTITSAQQLASEHNGCLAVLSVDPTSTIDADGFSLAGLIGRFREMLKSSPSAFYEFESKLATIGYADHVEYAEKFYIHKDTRRYLVNQEFPKILPESLPNAVVRVRYDLALTEIAGFMMEEETIYGTH